MSHPHLRALLPAHGGRLLATAVAAETGGTLIFSVIAAALATPGAALAAGGLAGPVGAGIAYAVLVYATQARRVWWRVGGAAVAEWSASGRGRVSLAPATGDLARSPPPTPAVEVLGEGIRRPSGPSSPRTDGRAVPPPVWRTSARQPSPTPPARPAPFPALQWWPPQPRHHPGHRDDGSNGSRRRGSLRRCPGTSTRGWWGPVGRAGRAVAGGAASPTLPPRTPAPPPRQLGGSLLGSLLASLTFEHARIGARHGPGCLPAAGGGPGLWRSMAWELGGSFLLARGRGWRGAGVVPALTPCAPTIEHIFPLKVIHQTPLN